MNDVLESIIAQSNLDSEIEDFLSHHGVKGQHWGIRQVFRGAQKGDWRTRSKAQKVGLVAGGYVGVSAGSAATNLVSKVLFKNYPVVQGGVNIAGAIVGGKLGARFTRNILQRKGKKKLKLQRKIAKIPKV